MAKARQRRHRSMSPQQFSSSSSSPSTHHNEHNESRPVTPLPAVLAQKHMRLLICSIGNPGSAYSNTLHSAGHTLLAALATSLALPSLRAGKTSTSSGCNYTLWQSPAFMNVSGPAVSKAWKQFQSTYRGDEVKLVVVHDELELPLGQVNVKSGSGSARGHNGLKSIKEAFGGGGSFTRIGVGIGRPESREPTAVAAYVLKKTSSIERRRIEECVGKVELELRNIVRS